VKPRYRGTLSGKIVGTLATASSFWFAGWLLGEIPATTPWTKLKNVFRHFFHFSAFLFGKLQFPWFIFLNKWTIPHPLREVFKLLFIFLQKVDTILDLTPAILEIPRHRLYSRIISEKRKAYEILMPGKRKFPLPPTTTSIHLINLN
jgi:hypothetical protein